MIEKEVLANIYIMQLKSILHDQFQYIFNYMNPQSSQLEDQQKLNPREFKCPCGKAYLSNAALYTHIKQKHQGKAPGQIQRPTHEPKPRGRPPLSKKMNEKNERLPEEEELQKGDSNIYKQSFEAIQILLRQIHHSETISSNVYEQQGEDDEDNTMKLFHGFLEDENNDQGFEGEGVSIGRGLAQFFQSVLMLLPETESEKNKGEQVFLLFMYLLQYSIDECNDKTIIKKAGVQELILFINPFIQEWISDYAKLKAVNNLWIMQRDNMIKVFNCFYSWLKFKQYTSYCITLIG